MEVKWGIFALSSIFNLFYVTFAADDKKVKHPLGIPPNIHGVEPTVFIKEEQQLIKGNLLTTIPIVSTEWSVSFDIRFDEVPLRLCNILHISSGTDQSQAGWRIPAFYAKGNSMSLLMKDALQVEIYEVVSLPAVGVLAHIETHRRYAGNGQYKVVFMVNGDEFGNNILTDSQLFHNVKVYASNPTVSTCNAFISNFKHTNFL